MNNRLYYVRYLLTRHGAYAKSAQSRIWNPDAALTQEGIAQAKAAGITLKKLLGEIKPDVYMASPFVRAQQTAQLISDGEWIMNPYLAPSPELVEEVEQHGRFISLAQIEEELPGHREKLRQRIIIGLEQGGSMRCLHELGDGGQTPRVITVVTSGHQPFYGMAVGHYLNAIDGQTFVFDQTWQEPVKTGDIVDLLVGYNRRFGDSAAGPMPCFDPVECEIALYDGKTGEMLRQASAR